MDSIPSDAALILIDMQQGLLENDYWGPRNNPDAEANAARLLAAWRDRGGTIVHVKHNSVNPTSPLRPELSGNAHIEIVAPQSDEPVFEKTVNSAFIGTGLQEWLHSRGITTVVICGMTTNHCVETSVRMAANLGFTTFLVGDACMCNDRRGPDGRVWPADVVHAVSLASLHDEFATVLNTDNVLAAIR